jgi:hypothetical protein
VLLTVVVGEVLLAGGVLHRGVAERDGREQPAAWSLAFSFLRATFSFSRMWRLRTASSNLFMLDREGAGVVDIVEFRRGAGKATRTGR